jgi:glycosyltransferase involved in cell wall biosynthesis
VRDAGLEDRVLFLGVRPDIAELMRGAFDVFLFPSLHEGLGIVLVEAQAAGLPCVLTSTLPDEVEIVPGLMTRLALDEAPSVWAHEVLAARDRGIPPADALALVEDSTFNIEHGLTALADVYASRARALDVAPCEGPSPQEAYAAQ